MTYYFAYGSNLNVEAMKRRCPKARKIGKLHLPHSRLIFRGVADVEYDPKERVPGGVWRITKDCEAALDMYEGVKGGLYEKIYVPIRFAKSNRVADMLIYQMPVDRGIMPPGEYYLSVIAQGYKDFGLDLDYLDMALARSWGNKKKTPFLKRRHKKRGDGALARDVNSAVEAVKAEEEADQSSDFTGW